MSKVLARVYEHEGKSVEILFSETIYFNATVAGKVFGKKPNDWLRLKDTSEYIEALINSRKCYVAGIPVSEQNMLVKRINGGDPKNQGTFLHNDLKQKYTLWLEKNNTNQVQNELYVILFSTGIIKVGVSYFASKRIKQHEYESSKYGVTILRSYINTSQTITEIDLISYCNSVSTNHVGKEYFSGLDFDSVVSFMKPRVSH